MLRDAALPGIELNVCRVDGANIAAGRNAAIREASKSVLAITDAGCRLEHDWLERITAPLLEDERIDAVAGGYVFAGASFLQRATIASSLPPDRMEGERFLPSSRSFAVRRDSMFRAGLYPEDMTFAGEDTALCLRMRSMGMRFVNRLDARVHWFVRRTLRGFMRQHFMYGLGDGEARSHSGSYLLHVLRLAVPLALLCLGVGWWPAAPLAVLLLALYYLRLSRVYGWKRLPLKLRAASYALLYLKIAMMTAGWIRGILAGPPGRRIG
jgi:cellulose synthase/poly-beta-1,6-N-acetylglucosamine synthase-like glycosyltransferase